MPDKVNILIVDDLPEKHVVMHSILDDLDQNVVSARSGREALRLILQMEFAVILLDVNMPDIDGLETASLIRQYKRTSQTPILFITAYVDELQARKGYALGAVDYISSPVIPEVLRSKVKVFVDLHRMHRQLQLQSAEREALARSEAARTAAEGAIQRADYLADASHRLSRSLSSPATTEALADVAVPTLGRSAAVVLLDSHGELSCRNVKLSSAHEPTVPGRHKLNPTLVTSIHAAMLLREIQVVAPLEVWGPDAGAGAGARPSAGPFSADVERMAVCPLVAGDQMLGALLLFGKRDDFSSAGLALISEVVGRASIAMENARLYTLVQDADLRKNEFLAMLAHELRNPLAPIRNAVHIIQGSNVVDPTVGWARDVISRQVDHMSRMVDDLLDVSRIVRGKVTVHMEPVLLSTLCERAVEASDPLLLAMQQRLEVNLPDEAVVLRGDLVRLSQVLSNLLNNASKFTGQNGRIGLSASVQGKVVKLVVSDDGQGIEPEFLPRMFDLFAQGDQALDRAQGGLGIGLTLVKRLVELHDGRVEAFSEGKGKGTRISLYLPVTVLKDGELPLPAVPGTKTLPSYSSRRVMVVDDLVASADTLKVLLEMEGFEVRVATEGHQALAIASEFRPDVVVLDIGLPGMDGFEVARRLRSSPESAGAVLIALTGYGEAESRQRSKDAGFDHHVVKPADIDFLLSIVGQENPQGVQAAGETLQD